MWGVDCVFVLCLIEHSEFTVRVNLYSVDCVFVLCLIEHSEFTIRVNLHSVVVWMPRNSATGFESTTS